MIRQNQTKNTKNPERISQECEIWMDAITHGSPIPQFAIDSDHRVIYWNKALEIYSGIKAEDVLGTNRHLKAFYPDERPTMADLLVDGLEDRIPEYYTEKEKETPLIEGTYDRTHFFPAMGESGVWLHFTVAAIRDETGTIAGAIETLEDVTELKERERELRESEAYIRTVLDNLPIGISVNSVDPEVSFEYFNDNFLKIYRTTAEKLSSPDLFWDIVYEDPVFRDKIRQRVMEDSASGDPGKMHWEDIPITRLGEETAFINAMNIPIPGKGLVISAVWDVTERKRAEDNLKESQMKLKDAMDLAHMANWELDVATGIFTFDDQFFALYGTTVEQEGSNRMTIEEYAQRFVHPDDRNIVKEELQRAAMATDAGYISTWDQRIIRRDGEIRFVVVRLGAIQDKNGKTILIQGANQDITIRKKALEALSVTNKKLNMLSSITRHDILNLIMVIRGYIELSEDTEDKTVLKNYILKEKEAVNAIQHQIEFTQYYQNIGMKEPIWHNLNDIVNAVSGSLNTEGIQIDNSLKGVEVFADPLIEKVFYNLMENSIRHGEHVTAISLTHSDTDAGLIITYTDNGVGITENERTMLFIKGYGKNTGLGLFLSREILSITGTTIQENGRAGEGVRFEITFPKGNYRLNPDTD